MEETVVQAASWTFEVTPAMLAIVAVIMAILQVIKTIPKIKEQTQVFPLISLALGIVGCVASKIAEPFVSGVIIGLLASGSFDLIKQTGMKIKGFTVPVVLMFVGLSFIAGCSDVWWASQYDVPIRSSNVVIQELNKKCQAGDPNSCRLCSQKASETIQLIINGRDGIGGDR